MTSFDPSKKPTNREVVEMLLDAARDILRHELNRSIILI